VCSHCPFGQVPAVAHLLEQLQYPLLMPTTISSSRGQIQVWQGGCFWDGRTAPRTRAPGRERLWRGTCLPRLSPPLAQFSSPLLPHPSSRTRRSRAHTFLMRAPLCGDPRLGSLQQLRHQSPPLLPACLSALATLPGPLEDLECGWKILPAGLLGNERASAERTCWPQRRSHTAATQQ
jgi:hypothetical protein